MSFFGYLTYGEKRIMASLADVTASIKVLSDDVAALTNAIRAATIVTPTELDGVVASLKAVSDQLVALEASLVTPPAPAA